MMKITFFFLFTFFTSHIFACEIKTFKLILKINPQVSNSIIKESNCDKKINNQFINILSNSSGIVNNQMLKRMITAEKNVEIFPQNINIQYIDQYLSKNHAIKDAFFKNTRSLNNVSFIGFNDHLPIFHCSNCNSTGKKNISLKDNEKTHWLSSDLYQERLVLKAKNNIPYSIPVIDSSDFYLTKVPTIKDGGHFTDINHIQFYRLTKNINAGEIIQSHNLVQRKIISRGQKVKIYIRNKSINLTTIGKAMKDGLYGQFIEVQNPKSKKVTLAKVIDFNKVLVEL